MKLLACCFSSVRCVLIPYTRGIFLPAFQEVKAAYLLTTRLEIGLGVLDESVNLEELSDQQLLDSARTGDTDAFGELWNRYRRAGINAARFFGSRGDNEDVVSEAFTRVFALIRQGKGPNDGFKPYLVSTIRHLLIREGKFDRESTGQEIDEILQRDPVPDFTDLSSEQEVLRSAFKTLPERWREVLWQSEVLGVSAPELSKSLGISPNALSALSLRAKEGLKRAWITSHLHETTQDATCHSVIEQLPALARGRVAKRAKEPLLSHIANCEHCARLHHDAETIASQLRSALLPTIGAGAGVGGAVTLLSDGGSSAEAVAFQGSPGAAPLTAGAKAGSPLPSFWALSPKAIAGLAASVLVVAGGAIAGIQFIKAPDSPLPTAATSLDSNTENSDGAKGASKPGETSANERPHSADHGAPTAVPTLSEEEVYEETTLAAQYPAEPVFFTPSSTLLTGDAATIHGGALPHAEVVIYRSGPSVAPTIHRVSADQNGNWSLAFVPTVAGKNTLRAYQIDTSGQRSPAKTQRYSADANSVLSSPVITNIDTANGTLSPTLDGTGSPGSVVQVSLNGNITGTNVRGDGTWSISALAGAVKGKNTLTAVQGSLISPHLSTSTPPITIDLDAPTVEITVSSGGGLDITVAAQPNHQVILREAEHNFSHTLAQTSERETLRVFLDSAISADDEFQFEAQYVSVDGEKFGPLTKAALAPTN